MNNDVIYLKLLKASRETGLPVKKILDLFFLLKDGKRIDNLELAKKLGVSKNVLHQVKKQLAEFLDPNLRLGTTLSKESIPTANTSFKQSSSKKNLYSPEEDLWRFLEADDYQKIIKLLKKYQHLRSKPKREWDQFFATLETTAKRAVLIDFFADIKGKRILLLGDDDLLSIALNYFQLAKEIVVLDIDRDILNLLSNISNLSNLEKYDVREELPEKYKGEFDIVFTDPPYTVNGVSLFLSRAIQALDPKNQAARIYFCYGSSDRAKERFLPIYEILIKSGLMIRWVFDKFNRYDGAESIGSASSLFVCDVTPRTRPLIKKKNTEKIYTV